jgi:hypothetical protein
LAYKKPTGKKALQAELSQQKVRVQQAQDELNRTVNGKFLDPNSAAYIAANLKFNNAVKRRDELIDAIANYVETEKPKSAREIELQRQRDILEGKVSTGGTISGDPNTDQNNVASDFKGMLKTADQYLRKTLDDQGRLLLATQLSNAGFDVPKIGAYNQALLAAYRNAIKAAEGENKQFPEDVSTVDDYILQQINIQNQIKATQSGTDERYSPFGQQEIFNKSTTEGVIESIFSSLDLGEASKSQINTLYKQLQAEQKKYSSMSKGTYKMVNGRRVLVRESGLDARTFLENKVKELDVYKESQAAKSEKNRIDLASTALANGYNLETDFAADLPNWLDAINKGKSIDEFKNKIRKAARRILPEAIRNQIDEDEDLSTTFSTYMSNIARARNLPISAIKLNDVIPLAITDKGFADSQQFEVNKRSQAWWDSSPEGISITTTVLNDTLKDWGMLGQGVRTA